MLKIMLLLSLLLTPNLFYCQQNDNQKIIDDLNNNEIQHILQSVQKTIEKETKNENILQNKINSLTEGIDNNAIILKLASENLKLRKEYLLIKDSLSQFKEKERIEEQKSNKSKKLFAFVMFVIPSILFGIYLCFLIFTFFKEIKN